MGEACHKLGRKFVGVEMCPDNHGKAARRIKAATAQLDILDRGQLKADRGEQAGISMGAKVGGIAPPKVDMQLNRSKIAELRSVIKGELR